MSKKKRNPGQQPKWEAFTLKMDELLDGDGKVGNAIIYTDEDLVWMVNQELPKECQISIASFKRYKAGDIDDDEVTRLFVSRYKRALMIQRRNLMEAMASDIPGGWQKWAWIMERKFDEWNLRSRSVDETPDVKRLVFRVKE
jgi:hypothetical protein